MSVDRTLAFDPGIAVADTTSDPSPCLGRTYPALDSASVSEGEPATRTESAATLPARIGGHPIVTELGRGGMGVVYLAYEPALERHVALKTLADRGDEDPAVVTRLLEEARTAGRLSHAGIVPIHRIGFDAEHGAFYTMRYVEGRTFAAILGARRDEDPDVIEQFPRRRLVRLLLDVCRAVGFAHTHGVLHRDLKPSNMIVTGHGEALVIDWGLACRADAVHVSGRGGTLGYLAPECVRGAHDVGPASDVYSLGAVLHEVLTLRVPCEARTPKEIVERTLHGNVESLDPTQVWAPLVPLVRRCLALDPQARFVDANALADELENVLEGRAPLREVAVLDEHAGIASDERWTIAGGLDRHEDGWRLAAGGSITTIPPAVGEWRAEFAFEVPRDLCGWRIDLGVLLEAADEQPYLDLVVGRDERISVSLWRRQRLVGRCLDLRLVPGGTCRAVVRAEGSRFVVVVDDRTVIDVHEPFPLSRSNLRVTVRGVELVFHELHQRARGAPLYLSYLSLPDRLVHQRRFGEARELYLELNRAHPERAEGHAALYKAALCAIELGDLAQATREFCELESGPLDHACALGLARVGIAEGNLDWSTTALADAYRRHSDVRTRRELWFALMNLLDHLPASGQDERVERAGCLLAELDPQSDDAEQMTLLLLDRTRADQGAGAMRRLAMQMLETFPGSPGVVEQALMSLHYGGLDEIAMSVVGNVLPAALRSCNSVDRRVRFLLMGAEVALAQGEHRWALEQLGRARAEVPPRHPDQVWTLGWTALARWLSDEPEAVLELAANEGAARVASTQSGHLTLLQALASTACGDHEKAAARLATLRASDHLWGRTAAAMLDGCGADRFARLTVRYPRRLLPEAAFYLAEYQRCARVGDRGQDLFARIADEWCDRALFKRVSERRRRAA